MSKPYNVRYVQQLNQSSMKYKKIILDGVEYDLVPTKKALEFAEENLSVTKFRNGDDIPIVKDREEWIEMTTSAMCYYDNDPNKGALYNWYAVNDPRGLAPEGWKIPTIKELEQIDLRGSYLGGSRHFNGLFNSIGTYGYWWSSTEYNTNEAYYRYVYYDFDNPIISEEFKVEGLSVRCLRDIN